MLSKIQIQEQDSTLWFRAVDCAQLLNTQTGHLTNRSYVAHQPIGKCKYIDETSFRTAFKANVKMLAELDKYKIEASEAKSKPGLELSCSNLANQIYYYVSTLGKDILDPYGMALPVVDFKENLKHLEVAELVLEMYLKVRFIEIRTSKGIDEEIDRTHPIYAMSKLLHLAFPIDLDAKLLYDFYNVGPLTKESVAKRKDLIAAISRADVNPKQLDYWAYFNPIFAPGVACIMAEYVCEDLRHKLLTFKSFQYPLDFDPTYSGGKVDFAGHFWPGVDYAAKILENRQPIQDFVLSHSPDAKLLEASYLLPLKARPSFPGA